MTSNKKDPVLVVLQMTGAYDALNTFIPYSDPHYVVADETHQMLVEHARKSGVSSTDTPEFPQHVTEMLQMIVATKEYLYA